MKLLSLTICSFVFGFCPLFISGEGYLRGSADESLEDAEWERYLNGPDDVVEPEPNNATKGNAPQCFSSLALVQEEQLGPVPMKELKVGQKILTQSGEFLQVYSFAHYQEDVKADFLQIHTSKTEHPLEISGQHLVYLYDKSNPVRADSVHVGDHLLLGPDKAGAAAEIIKIDKVQRQGLYAPLTIEGNLVVDGVVASSYVSLQENGNEFIVFTNGTPLWFPQHDIVHMALSPFRMICMGVSSNMCNTYNPIDGKPYFVSWGLAFAEWADQLHLLFQPFVLSFFLLVCAAFMLVEATFGASFGPLALFLVAAYYAKVSTLDIRMSNLCKAKKVT